MRRPYILTYRRKDMKSKYRIRIYFFALLFLISLACSSCFGECTHESMGQTIVPPSCSSSGYTVYACHDCSFSYESNFLSPTPHTVNKTEVAPTCTAVGYTVNECSECAYSYVCDTKQALEHNFVSTTIEPTCYEAGYTLNECSECDYATKENPTPVTAHELKSTVVSPTCAAEGYTAYSCENCNFSYTADHISALSHAFEETVIEPNCTEQGYTTKTCSVCSHEIITNYTEPTAHSFSTERKRATSSSDGYTLYSCTDCDYSYKTDYEYSNQIFTGAYANRLTPIAKGVDVSTYNGKLDWAALKAAGIDFAIIRAGSSISGEDIYFDTNYNAAREAGIYVGAYYYVEVNSTEEILLQVELLKEILGDKKFEYPIYLDIEKDSLGEALGRELLTEMCVEFIESLQADGYFAALYTNNNWLNNFYDRELVTEKYDVWYARYIPAENLDSAEWNLEKYGPTMCIWQYTNEGVIEGVASPIDLNFSYKNYPEIIKFYHYNGY